jgi:hypothetical protein
MISDCVDHAKDTQLFIILKCEVKLNEEGVVQARHHISLSGYIWDLVLFYNMTFLQNFNLR